METKLVVTIDVEEEQKWGTFKAKGNTTKHLENIDSLQKLFERYGVRPTYLLNWDALKNKKAVLKFKKYLKAGKCEIGSHIHPWATPPFKEKICERNTFANNLPAKLVEQKLKNVTNKIKKEFKIKPVTFKAGRHGFDENSAKILKKWSYLIDTSITPFMSHEKFQGPSFVDFPYFPYYLDINKIRKEDKNCNLLEIPTTIGYNIYNFKFANKIYQKESVIKKILAHFNLIERIKFNPEDYSAKELKKIADIFIKKGSPVLHMEFHSENIMPGFVEYVKTEEDLNKLYSKLKEVFDYLTNKKKILSMTCFEFYEWYKQSTITAKNNNT